MRGLPLSPLGLTLLLVSCGSVDPGGRAESSGTIDVQLLAFNDFHGSLEAPESGLQLEEGRGDGAVLRAGGVARLATLIEQRAAGQRHSLVVAAGDLVGASPLLSSSFHDEPTIEALGALGLSLSAVGNHEFDEGLAELQRLQHGGCHPQDGCKGPEPFTGAKFQYLAANVVDDNTGQQIFPGHAVRQFEGIPVGFIGLTLDETPMLLAPANRSGLRFLDEAATINREVRALVADGVEAIVVLMHEGGTPGKGADACTGMSGSMLDIIDALDAEVDLVISGHTHRAYNCTIAGRLVTSAGQYGMQLSDITLTLDKRSGDVATTRAETLVVPDTLEQDPALAALVDSYQVRVANLMQRQVGVITAPMLRDRNAAGENVMGAVIADAMLAAAARNSGANVDVALMNPGGVRNDLRSAGPVTYSDIFTVQPFGNALVVLTLTGADIEAVLREQFTNGQRRILHVSEGFSYRWNEATGLVAGSVSVNGTPLDAQRQYRVVTNDFIAAGGDGFTAFAAASASTPAGADIAALEAYLARHKPLKPPRLGRITLEEK